MHKSGLIITSFANTEEKNFVLLNLVKSLQSYKEENNLYLVLSSHCPVPIEIQEFCDYTIYEKENQVDSRKFSHGVAECNLINHAFRILEDKGITYTFKLTYDCIIEDFSIFEEWKSKNAKLVIPKWFTWGIGAFAFYTDIKFFRKHLHLFRTIDKMFEYSENHHLTFLDGTVLIEKIWMMDLILGKIMHEVFVYSDSVEMMGSNCYCNLFHSDGVYE